MVTRTLLDLRMMNKALPTKRDKANHPNYRFLVSKANGKVLDFGCGNGDLVNLALDAGLDAYGVEYFGAGSGTNIQNVLNERGLLGNRVHEYDGRLLPFPDDEFDTVVSNQVFEHVPDLDQALTEIARVLKPGGRLICSFPYKGAIREGHANALFVHWLPQGRARFTLLLMHRVFGVGRLKHKGYVRWARFFNRWLDESTFYRSGREVKELFETHFASYRHIEADYMHFRYGPRPLSGLICRRLGSLVIEAVAKQN